MLRPAVASSGQPYFPFRFLFDGEEIDVGESATVMVTTIDPTDMHKSMSHDDNSKHQVRPLPLVAARSAEAQTL